MSLSKIYSKIITQDWKVEWVIVPGTLEDL